jgi:transposase
MAILENRKDEISPRMRGLIADLYEDWAGLDERIETIAGEIETIGEKEANCRRLMSIPGIGPLISTAVVAAIGTDTRCLAQVWAGTGRRHLRRFSEARNRRFSELRTPC